MKRKCEVDERTKRLKKCIDEIDDKYHDKAIHHGNEQDQLINPINERINVSEEMEQENNNEEDDDDDNHHQFNEINTLKSLLTIMHPMETVLCTIKRLRTATTNNKLKQRIKQRGSFQNELTSEELKKNKFLLEEMTGLVDRFVSNDQPNIYQETYEQLKTRLNQ
ncbi:hypothetical protein I4U23_021381 [Adineta vaga]|nr:hypothetical protein I4U23_021381 [Adineta vaga]